MCGAVPEYCTGAGQASLTLITYRPHTARVVLPRPALAMAGLADKYEYEYWSIFVFIFKDFGLNLIIFMFIDWLCLNMNIFTTSGAEEAQNRLYISFNSTKALCIN